MCCKSKTTSSTRGNCGANRNKCGSNAVFGRRSKCASKCGRKDEATATAGVGPIVRDGLEPAVAGSTIHPPPSYDAATAGNEKQAPSIAEKPLMREEKEGSLRGEGSPRGELYSMPWWRFGGA